MRYLNRADYNLARKKMVERQLIARDIHDSRVIDAMSALPRHVFVDEALAHQAYSDTPLPIGEKQTISQPHIVACMTEALELKGPEIVLEIGTGSGYQTAILAELCYRVYTVERIRSLSFRARRILAELGYRNVVFRVGDGTVGWAEYGPFDGILVTAGGPDIPSPLVELLAPGGRMIIPVGATRDSQTLVKLVKTPRGKVVKSALGGCRFVDLIGQHGWND